MNQTIADKPDILVVGLGPVGGVFAALSGQLGLNVTVIERDTEIYKNPRAVQIDHEILRQINMIGVADKVLENSRPSSGYEFVNKDRKILVSRSRTDLSPTGYRWNNLFHQPSFETAVRQRLSELPNVQVHLGCELTQMEQNADGVNVTFSKIEGDQTLTADYVVGCDGGRSFVRRFLGGGMHDMGFDEPWLVVDVKLPEGVDAITDKGIQLCDPDRPTTSTQSGPGRHRWEFMLKPDEDLEEVTREESIMRRIADWVDPETVTLERNAVYQFHGLIANKWHDDRIMIIGDAAHQMPPFLGQGLCSGVRDATNLAWKLAAVINKSASPALLETVQSERTNHVTTITESAIELGKLVCITDKKAAEERDKKIEADQKAGKAPPFPIMPNIVNGILDDDTAGKILPEPFTKPENDDADKDPVRVDDVTGFVPLIIIRSADAISTEEQLALAQLQEKSPDIRIACLENAAENHIPLLDSSGHMSQMLGDARALIAKPDRIVFGKGDIIELTRLWISYLQGEPFIKEPSPF